MVGRPFPLNGSYFANVFIHFQPVQSQDEESSLPIYVSNSTEADNWYRSEIFVDDEGMKDDYTNDDRTDEL